ncbi:MAG: hypothetical protein H6684_08115 [Deltaproteobacteria bacterium]|nr:hypothetical protein [Deltaproteobacteria bacterium]MCB9488680.1 hypothetical protein [Deltaproteobacteria bacterium]
MPESTPTGFDTQVKTLKCESCGAQISYDIHTRSLTCPYCGSNHVIETAEPDIPRPQRLVLFQIDRDKALELFWKWLGNGWFRPRDLTSSASVENLRGVYLPFWAVGANAESSWTGDAGYDYTEQEPHTVRDAQGQSRTEYRTVTKTRWQPASGQHQSRYDDLLVVASAAMTQAWETNIQPFDMTKAVPYAPEYLMGYAAENPTTTLEVAVRSAKEEFHRMEHEACEAMVPGDRYQNVNVVTRLSNVTHDLALLPLWIAAYRYKGEVYRFLVNGQSGKVQGKAPTSWAKVVALIVGIGAAVGIGALIYSLTR